ncbi:hypothetical protein QAD02_018396 [Eretmocerus hayati]|uniref:Uncharacterized protein n=1 Tax=Eretmocerus hayati TaxID=131215 RepID=A0ACC2PH32_9HYME|nr:hypothetical protein QAD02_018396 [Eretmocerus hayati]
MRDDVIGYAKYSVRLHLTVYTTTTLQVIILWFEDNQIDDSDHCYRKTSVLPPFRNMLPGDNRKTDSGCELERRVEKLQDEVKELKIKVAAYKSVGCQDAGQKGKSNEEAKRSKKDKNEVHREYKDGKLQSPYKSDRLSFPGSRKQGDGGYKKKNRGGRWVKSRQSANHKSRYDAQQDAKRFCQKKRQLHGGHNDWKTTEHMSQQNTAPYVRQGNRANSERITQPNIKTDSRKITWYNSKKNTGRNSQQYAHPYKRNDAQHYNYKNSSNNTHVSLKEYSNYHDVNKFADLHDELERRNALQIYYHRMASPKRGADITLRCASYE